MSKNKAKNKAENKEKNTQDPTILSYKKTLGITGTDPEKIARLYYEFVLYCCNVHKIQKDQDHPPSILCYTSSEEGVTMCEALGADIVINADTFYTLKSENKITGENFIFSPKPLKTRFDRLYTFLTQDTPDKYQKKHAADLALYSQRPKEQMEENHAKRDGFTFLGDPNGWSKTTQGRLMEESVEKAKIDIGIIGGAGTLTGAHYCLELSKQETPPSFVMLSDTTAPDKNNSLMINGRDFAPNYLSRVTTLDKIVKKGGVIAIPCNTAHAKKGKFFPTDVATRLCDIGDATLLTISNSGYNKAILLGTPTTITHEKSPYNTKKLKKWGITLVGNISEDKEMVSNIYEAIYMIKGFRSRDIISAHRDNEDISKRSLSKDEASKEMHQLLEDAKEIILGVIRSIREKISDTDGKKIPVILGCTELPIVFTDEELTLYNLVSTTECLAQVATKVIEKEEEKSNASNARIDWDFFRLRSRARSRSGSGSGSESKPIQRSRSPERKSPKERIEEIVLEYDIEVLAGKEKFRVYLNPKDSETSDIAIIRDKLSLLMYLGLADAKGISLHDKKPAPERIRYFSLPKENNEEYIDKIINFCRIHDIKPQKENLFFESLTTLSNTTGEKSSPLEPQTDIRKASSEEHKSKDKHNHNKPSTIVKKAHSKTTMQKSSNTAKPPLKPRTDIIKSSSKKNKSTDTVNNSQIPSTSVKQAHSETTPDDRNVHK